jgi:hypothetical protein
MKNILLVIPLLIANMLVYANAIESNELTENRLDFQVGNILLVSAAETDTGLAEMLEMNEQTCLLLGISCESLNERIINIWDNIGLLRGEGVDGLLENWVIAYQRSGNVQSDNDNLVQALHNSVKETCKPIVKHPVVATFNRLQKQKAITFCESGIYNRAEKMLWQGWFDGQSPVTTWFNQTPPIIKANFDLGNLIKTQAGGDLPPLCPWDVPC